MSSLREMSVSLFDPELLTTPDMPAQLRIRPLQSTDYEKGYDCILQPLATDQPPLTRDAFTRTFDTMYKTHDPRIYYVIVITDISYEERVVASASLLVERKFLRGGVVAGHIEDVVVAPSHQGMKLGRHLIHALTALASRVGCYKIILDCSASNVGFYEKCGFQAKGVEMKLYL